MKDNLHRPGKSSGNSDCHATGTADATQWDFGSVANEYEKRVEPFTSSFVDAMLDPWSEKASTKEKEKRPRLLDVGCGTGAVSLRAIELGYHVTATDVSAAMVNRTKSRASRGISTSDDDNEIECLACDGMNLPEEWTNKFHYAVGSFSVIFFPDPLKGLKELYRCLVPSGNIVISAWGNAKETAAFRIFPDAIQMTLSDEAAKEVKPKRIEGSKETLTSLLKKAEFSIVHVVGPIERMLVVPSAEAFYNRFALTSPPIKELISRLEKDDKKMLEFLKKNVMELAIERGGQKDGTIQLPSSAYFAYGTKS